EPSPPRKAQEAPGARVSQLLLAIAGVLAPVQLRTLRSIAASLRRSLACSDDPGGILDGLVRAGQLLKGSCDAIEYVWPASDSPASEEPEVVRFLAPFDPIVWDRRRFEHLWGWPYRFEAYTPQAKRVRGYYAMPLLWRSSVIGWANGSLDDRGLDVKLGFVGKKPGGREFLRQTDAEIARLEKFLLRESEPS
ncbi:MAG: winged helix DNA-binding domain-containing protein, partial [Candidatus Wallbacteria bacterium]|nr:winged helix DNA-binding domain-containing protein [Candidatus Wallbacteria bacterium]